MIMSKLIKCFIVLFLLLPLSLIVMYVTIGIKPSVNLDGEYKLGRYIKGKRQNNDLIVIDSDLQQEINSWLKQRHRWCIDLNSYAPGSVVYADNFHMNRIGNIIVLNYKTAWSDDRWMQYSCPMDNEIKGIFTKLDSFTEQNITPVLNDEIHER